MIDPALNMKLRDGDPAGYEKLYSLTSVRLKNYCKLFLKDVVLIEDIVQGAYVRLWERHSLIRPEKSVESLLFTVVRNQCLNYLRDEKLSSGNISIDKSEWSDLQHLYQIDFSGVEEKNLEEQLFDALKDAISKLPERQSQILVRCKINGEKQQKVANEMGISLKAVEKSLAVSKQKLREILTAQFPELVILISFLLR